MDITKAQNLYLNLIDENNSFSIPNIIQIIINSIANILNNRDVENHTQILHDNLNNLKEIGEFSILETLTDSEIKFLEETNILTMFGLPLHREIQMILKKSINTHEQYSNMNQFNIQRNEFISKIDNISVNLRSLGVKPHYLNTNYEIGIRIPVNNKSNKLNSISIILKDFNFILRTLNEIQGNSIEDYNVEFTNNGSLILYVTQNPEVATILSEIFKNIAIGLSSLAVAIATINKLKNDEFNKDAIELLEQDVEKKLEEKLDNIVKQVIERYKGDAGRKNELEKATKDTVRKASSFIKNEIDIEFVAPCISERKELSKKELEEEKNVTINNIKEKVKIVKNVTDTMKDVKEIIENGKDVLDLISYDEKEE